MSTSKTLLPLATAVERATGQHPHPSTLHRWRLRGIAGVKLSTVRVGGRRMCSVESVLQFLERVTAASDGETVGPETPRQRSRAIARAEQRAKELGV